jgi:hypothetical protein
MSEPTEYVVTSSQPFDKERQLDLLNWISNEVAMDRYALVGAVMDHRSIYITAEILEKKG